MNKEKHINTKKKTHENSTRCSKGKRSANIVFKIAVSVHPIILSLPKIRLVISKITVV